MVFWSILLSVIGLFCVGPSEILRFPDKLWLIFVGLGLLGIGIGGITVPVLPEFVEAI
jgi:hypothetical protein